MNIYEKIGEFYGAYRGKKKIIGKTAEGRYIYALFVGREEYPVGISQYALHGREWITAELALFHIGRGVAQGGVWFVPLANPDGALLSQIGLSSVSPARKKTLQKIGGEFPLWKANADGVDPNVNFAARWGTGKSNIRRPASANYIGNAPFSAAESRALRNFTLSVSPAFTLSWHTKGEEIYWRFHQPRKQLARDKRYAEVLSASTGYPLKEAPKSAGGYKDWCVETLKIPAFTIEVGSDHLSHPIGEEGLGDIVERCGNAVYDFTEVF